MFRTILAACLLMLPATRAGAAEGGQLDASLSLFSVLAAINAAGYDADLDSPSNHPLRAAVRRELAARNLPSVAEIRKFFAAHRKTDWTQELSQYISYALSVDGPPAFQYRTIMNEVSPDAAALEGLGALLTAFAREADIESLWRKTQPVFDETIAGYHRPVTQAIMEVNGYLRSPTSGYAGRRFQIYVDLLGAPNQIHIRSYAKEYYVVVTRSPEPQVTDIRHAYLHYLLDPVSIKYGEEVNRKKSLIDFAQGAPALGSSYKEDFLLLVTECLIKAMESRLAPAAARQGIVDQALKEGFILTPFFAERLPLYEKQEQAMRLYFPDLVAAIDVKKETRRLEGVQFVAERAVRKAKVVPLERKAEPTGAQKTIQDAEEAYSKRDLEKAKALFHQALKETDEKPLHARACFGLARIAALQKDPELADKLFRKTLELGPDPQTRCWTHVYLGRLAEIARETDEAIRQYRSALAVQGASPAARGAAEKALNDYPNKDK